jgi:hypothetical protein
MTVANTPWRLAGAIALLLSPVAVRADIINGLQGRYDFDSPLAVGTDGSGNGNNGTLSPANAAWANDPIRGGVLSLSGAQSNPGFVLVPDSPSLSIAGDLTIAAFVKPNSYATFNSIVGKTTNNQPASYDLYLVQTSGLPRLFRGNGLGANGSSTGVAAPPIGVWHFVAVTMEGNQVTHYLDGVVNGTSTINTTMVDNDNPIYIGSRSDQFTAFNGSMDAVRIYNRALSPADIAELMAANVPEPSTAALTAACSFALATRRIRSNTLPARAYGRV